MKDNSKETQIPSNYTLLKMITLAKKMSIVIILLLFIGSCTAPLVIQPTPSWAEKTLDELTLREKIAQMMFYYMDMTFLNEESVKWKEIKELIKTDGIGGIHLWRGDAGTSLTMMNQMQRMSKVPILFDADLEYGLHHRFPGGTPLPPMMAIAATGDPHYAYEAGKITAIEGRAVGISLALAPVVDVNNNPANPIINTRSFGEDPEMVVKFATEFIRGLKDYGMASTAKHFPGHGDTETDSHTSLAAIPSDSHRLQEIELFPFQKVIDDGVDLVMIAHIHAPDYQPHAGTPATLSPFWIKEVLRNKMGFKGAIITDAMGMGGVTRNYTDVYALVATINSGIDLILQNNNFKRSIDTVEDAVKNGIISEERINKAALRMLKLKEQLGLHKQKIIEVNYTRKQLGKPEFKAKAKEIAAKAITLVKNEDNLVPLKLTDNDTVYVVDLYDYPYNHSLTLVATNLFKAGVNVKAFQLDKSDDINVIKAILNTIPPNGLVVINAFVSPKAWKNLISLPETQHEFISKLITKTGRIILNSFGTPYLIQDFPNISAYLCAYQGSELMQNALVNALLGKHFISGKLPVTIPAIASIGTGLTLEAKPLKINRRNQQRGLTLKRCLPHEVNANSERILQLLEEAVNDSALPGGVLLAAKDGKIFIHEAFGHHTYAKKEPTRRGDIFDLASVTKVVATTSAVMKLYEEGKLNLEDLVISFLPEFKGPTPEQTKLKATITIKHFLTHTSGLPPFKEYFKIKGTIQTRLDSIYNTALDTNPGIQFTYSDIGLILLGQIIEKVSGKQIDQFVRETVFEPLGMNSTYYNPPASRMKRIVPTEYSEEEGAFVRGHVHDENAYSLGGVTGHAGLFSTASDLAIFAQMMLNKGMYNDTSLFQPQTVELFTNRADVVPDNSRCLGWDSPSRKASGGVYLSDKSFGHTGFTGTSLWIDPFNQVFVILLTNAVHPHREWKDPKYYDWRQRIHSAIYESLKTQKQNPKLNWRDRWIVK